MIGQELAHGFDSQVRRYDASGNVRDGWTAAAHRFVVETAQQRLAIW